MSRLTPNMREVDRVPLSLPIPEGVYIQFTGQRRFEYLMSKIPDVMQQAANRGIMRFAKIVLQIVKKSMATGIPPSGTHWAPLKDRTKELYTKWGYPNAHPWNVMGELHRNVGIFKNRKNTWIGFPNGVSATNPNPKGQTSNRPTMNKLSKMLEWDGDYHTGRPLWNPAYNAAGGKSRLTRFIVEELREEVNKYRGIYVR